MSIKNLSTLNGEMLKRGGLYAEVGILLAILLGVFQVITTIKSAIWVVLGCFIAGCLSGIVQVTQAETVNERERSERE